MTPTNHNDTGQSEPKHDASICGHSSRNHLDREAILARMDGDEDLLREILAIFLEYAPRRLEEIRAAIKNGDFVSLRRTIHALKGSAGYLEAKTLLEAIYQLDQLAVSADSQRLPEALVEFEQHLEELTTAVAALVSKDKN